MRDILLLAIVALCAVNALRSPTFGMLAFVLFSTLNPHSMTWGFARSLPFAQMIAIPTLLGTLISGRRRKLPMHTETKLLLALWALFAVTTVFSVYPDRAREQLIFVSKILLMVLLSMYLIDSKRLLGYLIRIISLSLGFHGLKGGVFFILSGGSQMVWGPEESFLYANNSIGLALAMNVPFLWYLSATEENRWLRRLMRLMLVFSFPATIGTFSRGAWIALGVATVHIILHSRHRAILIAAAVVAGLVAIPYLPDRVTNRFEQLVNADEEASAQSRIHSWRFATNVALDKPLTGAGFDYYSVQMYEQYYPQMLVLYPSRYDRGAWSAHSIWFAILGQHGFTGIALWLVLLFTVFRSLKRIRVYTRDTGKSQWAGPYALMLQGGLLAYLVAGTFLDAAYFDLLYQYIAVVAIMKRLLAEEQEATDEAEAPARAPERRGRPHRRSSSWRGRRNASKSALY